MNFQECELGFTYKNSEVCVFFGKAICTLEILEKKFLEFEFLQINQTHSDILVEANQNTAIADAQWTRDRNKALLIRTADCIPAFFYIPKSQMVLAIHAGWRGVENQIILKSLKAFLKDQDPIQNIEAWIGPHILQSSFEVDSDVMLKLLSSSFGLVQNDIALSFDKKFQVDLFKIVKSQIKELRNLNIQMHDLMLDSKTNSKFHSFRRDGTLSGRNLSFIKLV